MGSTKKTGKGRFYGRQECKDEDKILRRKEAKEEIETEVRNAFYPAEGECRSCGSKKNVLETDKVLTGGRRHKLCQKCLDYKLEQLTRNVEFLILNVKEEEE